MPVASGKMGTSLSFNLGRPETQWRTRAHLLFAGSKVHLPITGENMFITVVLHTAHHQIAAAPSMMLLTIRTDWIRAT